MWKSFKQGFKNVWTLRVMCCPTSSSDRVALRPSVAVDVPLHRSVSCSCSQYRWLGSAMTRSVVRLAAKTLSFVAIESPTLPILRSCPWAIRQLTVESAIRRRIWQYRHGFSYAHSGNHDGRYTDSCSTWANEDDHKTQSQVTESTRKVGSPPCALEQSESFGSISQCPSVCHMSTFCDVSGIC